MGSTPYVTTESYPEQGSALHRRVQVMFHFAGPEIGALCIRDDITEPFDTIFLLDDNRVVRSAECQYTYHVD